VSVLPIFASLLHELRKALAVPGDLVPLIVLDAATNAGRVFLPLASLKANCDLVATCFWEVLAVFSIRDVPDESLLVPALDLCETIVSTFEVSFANYSNKKKVRRNQYKP
jgi:hypothetical protein